MMLLSRITILFAVVFQSALAVTWSTFSNVKVFGPGSGYTAPGVLYGRTAIDNDTLYATAENYSFEPPYFPIYSSKDGGHTWSHISDVHDTVNGWGMRWEPHLFVLPTALGSLSAGTLFLAADSVPKDRHAYNIDLYASNDGGLTWKFVSNIAKGGGDLYEPFILYNNGQLVVYFSDSRDTRYSQKLSYVASSDGKSWSGGDVVTSSTRSDRPGMPTVAKLPNGKWILTYEFGTGGGYPIYYKIADSPTSFNSVAGQALVAQDGTKASSGSPYVTWTSVGGTSGTVIVSFAGSGDLFISKSLGVAGSWTKKSTGGVPSAYSRSIMVLPDPTKLLIVGAGFNGNTLNSQVRADVVSIS